MLRLGSAGTDLHAHRVPVYFDLVEVARGDPLIDEPFAHRQNSGLFGNHVTDLISQ